MKQVVKCLFAILLVSSISVQAQNYYFTAIPDWVKLISIPEKSTVSKYEINGYYQKLVDYQINMEVEASFFHEVRNVISYSGITDASQLMVSFDSSYQHLQIHYLYVWRDGNKIDRTRDLSFEIINNELSLQQGIYNGTVSVYDNLEDIRKGDLIDFAYTVSGNNPIFGHHKYLDIPMASKNAIDLLYIRVVYPIDGVYTYECADCDGLTIREDATEHYREIEIEYPRLKAVELEDNIPAWSKPYKYFTITNDTSWRQVNEWAESVFVLDHLPDLTGVYNEVFDGTETIEQKITKLIDYVQDDIRYMGIETGIGSIVPFPPEQVVKQRFGDCKDKSLLLVWLLKNIGIDDAYPALVNTDLQGKLDNYAISGYNFNHCIVNYIFENDTFWVDPTLAMQEGNFRELYTPDYGKALIVGQASNSLQTMNKSKINPTIALKDRFIFSSFISNCKLEMTSTRSGFEADIRRYQMEYFSLNEVEDLVTEGLKKQFSGVSKTSDIIIDDNTDSNTFSMTYNYEIKDIWKNGEEIDRELANSKVFRFEPESIIQYLQWPVCDDRVNDFALSYPENVSYTVYFEFPKDMLIDDYFTNYDNDTFYFEEKFEQLNSHSFQVSYVYQTKQNFIEAADYREICKQKDEILEKLPIIIVFPN